MTDRMVLVDEMGGHETGWAIKREAGMTHFLSDDGWEAWTRDEYLHPLAGTTSPDAGSSS